MSTDRSSRFRQALERGALHGWFMRGVVAAVTVVVLVIPAAAVLAADPSDFQGRTLVDAIAELEQQGLVVYYSSDLVRPWMTVETPPAAESPEAILDEILAPFGLKTEPGPAGGRLIVRARDDGQRETGAILGLVVSRPSGRRVAGAEVHLRERNETTVTSPQGQFSFPGLPAGTYSVLVNPTEDGEAASATSVVERGRVNVVRIELPDTGVTRLESVVVSASRYDMPAAPSSWLRFLPIEDIVNLPDFGDDPMRAVARLPGTATSAFSAKSNIRGGEVDETLFRFDGLRLRDPFHLKDFQSFFSAIDPAIIGGMDVYTGGAPVRFGDRMSGVIDIHPVEAPPAPWTQVSQTFFNSSVVSTGSMDDGRVDWVASIRRGNLDLLLDVADPDLGDPKYIDAYGRMGVQVTDTLRVTGNALVFDDDIQLSDNDDEENAEATYHDRYFWVRFDQDLGDLRGSTILAHADLEVDRDGTIVREGVSTGRLRDERDFTIGSVQTDWSWRVSDRLGFDFGAESSYSEGDYEYEDEADFDLLFLTPGAATDPERRTSVEVDPSGSYYAAYASGRFRLTDDLTADVGLRWDRQTLSDDSEHLFSPRVGAVQALGERTAVRASWGRHYQSQGIHELQVSDGVTEFFKAQRADHFVVGLEHRSGLGIDLRLEAYHKDMDRLRPRFENLLNNKILLPELQPDRIRIDPEGATARGVEVSLSDRYNGPVSWWLSYSWASVKDQLPGPNIRRAWDQKHALQGGLEWRHGPWTLNLAGTYNSGWPTTDAELVEIDPIALAATATRNTDRLDEFLSIDARLAREWRLPASTVTVFAEVTNVTGRFNQCCVDYDVDDEDDEIQLDLDPENYLRSFPNVGVIWRFGKGAAYTR